MLDNHLRHPTGYVPPVTEQFQLQYCRWIIAQTPYKPTLPENERI
jgi:hypothetical protein